MANYYLQKLPKGMKEGENVVFPRMQTYIDYFLLKDLALSAFLFTFGARMRFPCQNPVFAEMGVKIANKGHDLLLI
jgi:hypothetical protein